MRHLNLHLTRGRFTPRVADYKRQLTALKETGAYDDIENFKIPSNKAGLITAWDNITISMYTTRKNISIDDLYIEEESFTIWSKQVESRGELSTYNNHNLCELFFSDGISIFRKGWEKLLGYIDSTILISEEEVQYNLTFCKDFIEILLDIKLFLTESLTSINNNLSSIIVSVMNEASLGIHGSGIWGEEKLEFQNVKIYLTSTLYLETPQAQVIIRELLD